MQIRMLMLLGLFAAGCATQDEPKTVVEPDFGKTDSLRSVQNKATITFDQAVEGIFDEDAAFHGYQFTSLPTGRITAEVTQRGSSRGLDTTMFLFGARSTNNWERLAFDDDAGWGDLSKIDEIDVQEYGAYMVVIGTANGLGRGNYRLQVTCTNGACLDTSPVDLGDCEGDIYDLVDTCVSEHLSDADFDWDDPAEEISIEFCAHDGIHEYVDYTCPIGRATNPDYCRATTEQLTAVGPVCERKLKADYNVVDTLNLGRLLLSGALYDLAEELEYGGDDGSWRSLEGYSVPPGATATTVAASVRQEFGRVSALSIGTAEPRDDYRQRNYLPTDVIDVIEGEHGDDYIGVNVSGSYYVAAGAEEWVDIEVLYYPNLNVAFAIISVSGET